MKKGKNKRGFTIVELVIVVAVIGILAAILIPTFVNLVDRSKASARNLELTNAYKAYQIDAIDGVYGDANTMSDRQQADYSIEQLDVKEIYLSKEKSVDAAKNNSYHVVDNKWVKGNPAALISIFKTAYQSKSFNDYYIFYAEEHVQSLSVNPTDYTIKQGVSLSLVPSFSPANSMDRGVTWTSSNPTIATVDEETGVVKGLTAGDVTITATANDTANGTISNTATIHISSEAVTKDDIVSVEPPKFVSSYAANTASLDKVGNLSTRSKLQRALGDSSSRRSTFFENEHGTRDVYKVGARNEFKFNYGGKLDLGGDLREGMAFYDNPDLEMKLYESSDHGETYSTTPAEKGENQKVQSISNNVINFNYEKFLDGDGKFENTSYKLVIELTNSEASDYEFEFEVFDGYNVYSLKELVAFDDRPSANLNSHFTYAVSNASSHTFTAEDDPWHDARGEDPINVDTVNGLALHTDIVITNDDIPTAFKYTEAEVNAYIQNNKLDFDAWADEKQDEYDQLYGRGVYKFNGKEALIGSLKDNQVLLNRTTFRDTEFNFEGNYFSIDVSKVKLVYAFISKTSSDPIASYSGISSNKYEGLYERASHLPLFSTNTYNMSLKQGVDKKYFDGEEDGIRGGNVNYKNISFKGNSELSNDKSNVGGLIILKNLACTANLSNILVSNGYIPFFSESNAYNDFSGAIHVDDEIRYGEMIIDRCKSFRSYQQTFYIYGTKDNKISNSILQDAGGPLIIMDDVNYKTSSEGNHRKGASGLDIENCYLENYVTGQEAWFASFGATPLLTTVLGAGLEGSWLSNIAKKAPHGKSFVNYYDYDKTIPMTNLISISFTGSANPPEFNYEKCVPLDSKVTLTKNHETSVLLDMKAVDVVMGGMMESELTPQLAQYVGYAAQHTEGTSALIFRTDKGGVGISQPLMNPSTMDFFASPVGSVYVGTNLIDTSYIDNLDLDNLTEEQQTVVDAILKLADGDYMTAYYRPIPTVGGMYYGMIFGME